MFFKKFLLQYEKRKNRTNGIIMPFCLRHLCPVGKGPGLNGLSYPLSVVIFPQALREIVRRSGEKAIRPWADVAFSGLPGIVAVKKEVNGLHE